mgnify:CR=1 FL=1|jgi:membrane protein
MSGLIIAAICGSVFLFGLMIARDKRQLIIVVAILIVFLAVWAILWSGHFAKETYPSLFGTTYLALVGLGINSWRFASAGGLQKPFVYIRSALLLSTCYFIVACILAVGLDWPAVFIALPFAIAFAIYKEVEIRQARRAREEEEENAGL